MKLLDAWRAVPRPTRFLAYALVALFSLALGGELAQWYGDGAATLGATAATRRRPVRLQPTKPAARIATAEKPAAVRVKAPTPREAEELERRFTLGLAAADAGDEQLVEVWQTPAAPAGGEVAVTVDATGVPSATFLAKPLPFFELGGPWEAGAGVAVTSEGYGPSVHAAKDLLRAGRLYVRVEGDADVLPSGVKGRAAVLGVIRF